MNMVVKRKCSDCFGGVESVCLWGGGEMGFAVVVIFL